MSEERSYTDYLQKAALYDFLGQFYKYTNPELHMEYYLKHLKYVNKAGRTMRITQQAMHHEARVRILHTSFDAPNIDVYMNGNRVIKDLSLRKVSSVLTLKPGKYHIDIYPAGKMIDSILNKTITVEAGMSYTLTTINPVKTIRLLSYPEQPNVPVNEAKVRFIHLSPHTEAIDIAVKDRDVIFPAVTYKQSTDYLGLMPMTVDLEVREAGTRNILLPLPKVHFQPNAVYTIAFASLSEEISRLEAIILTGA